jgi:hypothetical protein
MLIPELKMFLEMPADLKLQGEFSGLRLLRLEFLQFREETNNATFTTTLAPTKGPEALL